jgi:hypothetical protein
MAELSIAISPPSLKLRRALLAIHPRGKPRGILAKESKDPGPEDPALVIPGGDLVYGHSMLRGVLE